MVSPNFRNFVVFEVSRLDEGHSELPDAIDEFLGSWAFSCPFLATKNGEITAYKRAVLLKRKMEDSNQYGRQKKKGYTQQELFKKWVLGGHQK